MEELATVIHKNENKAEVKIIKHSACSKCDKSCGLAGDSHDQDEVFLEVEDTIGVKKGDRVLLEMEAKNLIYATLMVYLSPILLMIIGYFVGVSFAGFLGINSSELAGIIGTALFLIISFLINKSLNSYLEAKSGFDPTIKRIIN